MTFIVNFRWQKLSKSFSFFSLRNINLEAHFLLLTFFDNINFWITLLSKVKIQFWTPPHYITQFSKFNNFPWLCWFLGKNLSNFYPPFENSTTPTYCHNKFTHLRNDKFISPFCIKTTFRINLFYLAHCATVC